MTTGFSFYRCWSFYFVINSAFSFYGLYFALSFGIWLIVGNRHDRAADFSWNQCPFLFFQCQFFFYRFGSLSSSHIVKPDLQSTLLANLFKINSWLMTWKLRHIAFASKLSLARNMPISSVWSNTLPHLAAFRRITFEIALIYWWCRPLRLP